MRGQGQKSVLSLHHVGSGVHHQVMRTASTPSFSLLEVLAKSWGMLLLTRLREDPTLNQSLEDMWLSLTKLEVWASLKPPDLCILKVAPHKRILQSSLVRREGWIPTCTTHPVIPVLLCFSSKCP